MARIYETVPGSGFYCWSLEKCEEEIVIAALSEISGLIPPGQKWQRTLEEYFFERGKGLANEALIEINGLRKQHGLEPVHIRETAVGDYAFSRDELMKAQRRRQIRKELSEASSEVCAEEECFSPAFKLRKLQQNAAAPLSQEEAEEKRAYVYRNTEVRMPPRSEKHANFQRLAEKRKEQIREAYRKFGNLSASNYEFTESEVLKMFDTFREWLG